MTNHRPQLAGAIPSASRLLHVHNRVLALRILFDKVKTLRDLQYHGMLILELRIKNLLSEFVCAVHKNPCGTRGQCPTSRVRSASCIRGTLESLRYCVEKANTVRRDSPKYGRSSFVPVTTRRRLFFFCSPPSSAGSETGDSAKPSSCVAACYFNSF